MRRSKRLESKSAMSSSRVSISYSEFYSCYYGHHPEHLQLAYDALVPSSHTQQQQQQTGGGDKDTDKRRSVLFLAGDSSLDNKYWFNDVARAVNGYDNIIDNKMSKKDVAYCLNSALVNAGLGSRYVALNCAVEESKISSRDCGGLLPQDIFIRDHITSDDVLVVSVGGNDVALTTNAFTACSMLSLVCCSTQGCKRNGCGCAIPCVGDPCCLGGSLIGCLSNLCACPFGVGYFIHLMKTKLEMYLSRLIEKTKPRAVAICMIYFPSEEENGSWADPILNALCYNKSPAMVQDAIRLMYKLAIKEVRLPGTTVVPVPLFEVMDGKTFEDYCQRVEPSPSGGAKMADMILKNVIPELAPQNESVSQESIVR